MNWIRCECTGSCTLCVVLVAIFRWNRHRSATRFKKKQSVVLGLLSLGPFMGLPVDDITTAGRMKQEGGGGVNVCALWHPRGKRVSIRSLHVKKKKEAQVACVFDRTNPNPTVAMAITCPCVCRDGGLKRAKVKDTFKEEQQKLYSKMLVGAQEDRSRSWGTPGGLTPPPAAGVQAAPPRGRCRRRCLASSVSASAWRVRCVSLSWPSWVCRPALE